MEVKFNRRLIMRSIEQLKHADFVENVPLIEALQNELEYQDRVIERENLEDCFVDANTWTPDNVLAFVGTIMFWVFMFWIFA